MQNKFTRWLLMLLLLVLLGMTIWIFWAIQKLDGKKRPAKPAMHFTVPSDACYTTDYPSERVSLLRRPRLSKA